MTNSELISRRLSNQQIIGHRFAGPAELVNWLGAVQAQDYGAAKWALGLRFKSMIDDRVEAAFNAGEILRTHVLRPTWHFVSPADIRWMLKLTAPHVIGLQGYYSRKQELDAATFTKCNDLLGRALEGNKQLTREELTKVLNQAHINTDDLRLTIIMMRAELDGIICSGAKKGSQFTYALMDDRAPVQPELHRDEALAKLALIYFASRGPATVQDFAWWSGLSITDSRNALEMIKSQLINEVVDQQVYWFADHGTTATAVKNKTFLLPNFDEYIVGYQDRSAISDIKGVHPRHNLLFSNTIVEGGQVTGTWKRVLKKDQVVMEINSFGTLSKNRLERIQIAARRYGKFLKKEVVF